LQDNLTPETKIYKLSSASRHGGICALQRADMSPRRKDMRRHAAARQSRPYTVDFLAFLF